MIVAGIFLKIGAIIGEMMIKTDFITATQRITFTYWQQMKYYIRNKKYAYFRAKSN